MIIIVVISQSKPLQVARRWFVVVAHRLWKCCSSIHKHVQGWFDD